MNDFQIDLQIEATVSTVYEALTTQSGIQRWWTTSCQVGSNVGEMINLSFGKTFKEMRIESLRLNEAVEWYVTKSQLDIPNLERKNEWEGSSIAIHIAPQSTSHTRLHLVHMGLTPEVECYEICSSGWAHFLASLKDYCETGTGKPYHG